MPGLCRHLPWLPTMLLPNCLSTLVLHSWYLTLDYKSWNPLYGLHDPFGNDKARALKLATITLVEQIPVELEIVEILVIVVPARVLLNRTPNEGKAPVFTLRL